MILSQLRIGARQAKNAALMMIMMIQLNLLIILIWKYSVLNPFILIDTLTHLPPLIVRCR